MTEDEKIYTLREGRFRSVVNRAGEAAFFYLLSQEFQFTAPFQKQIDLH